MPWCVSPWVYPVWDSLCLLDSIDYFLFHVGEIFKYNLFKNFLIPFLLLFFFWEPYNSNVGVIDIIPEVSETILSFFHSFYFILLSRSYFLLWNFIHFRHWFLIINGFKILNICLNWGGALSHIDGQMAVVIYLYFPSFILLELVIIAYTYHIPWSRKPISLCIIL